jgi:hypothetical protein
MAAKIIAMPNITDNRLTFIVFPLFSAHLRSADTSLG